MKKIHRKRRKNWGGEYREIDGVGIGVGVAGLYFRFFFKIQDIYNILIKGKFDSGTA